MKAIKIFVLVVFVALSTNVIAQQNYYKNRIGLNWGAMGYVGDLSNGLNQVQFWEQGHGATLERSTGKAFSLRLAYNKGTITHSDRVFDTDNRLNIDNENWQRALNFQTEIRDLGISLIYYLDNGKLFSEKARLAPFWGFGFGITDWEVYGDLTDEDGDRYYYWSDGTVRGFAEDPDAGVTGIISPDGVYETDLSTLLTNNKEYETRAFHIPVTVGFKYRLTDRINLNAETTFKYLLSDFLDDTSGKYPATTIDAFTSYATNPSGITPQDNFRGSNNRFLDLYYFSNFSLNYNIGFKKKSFKAPLFIADKYSVLEADQNRVYIEGEEEMAEKEAIELEDEMIEREIEVDTKEDIEGDKRIVKIVKRTINEDGSITETIEEREFSADEDEMIWIDEMDADERSNKIIKKKRIETIDGEEVIVNEVEEYEEEETDEPKRRFRRKDRKNDVVITEPVSEERIEEMINGRYELQQKEIEKLRAEIKDLRKSSISNINNDELTTLKADVEKIKNATYDQQSSYWLTKQVLKLRKELNAIKGADEKVEIFETEMDEAENDSAFKLYNELSQQFSALKADLDAVKNKPEPMPIINVDDSEKIASLENEIGGLRNQISDGLSGQTNSAELRSLRNQLSDLTYKVEYLSNLKSNPATNTVTYVSSEPSYSTIPERVNVYFDSGNSELSVQGVYDLDNKVIPQLQANQNLKVSLKGFADKTGSSALNMKLSQARVNAVQKYITDRAGIGTNQILSSYFGEEHPNASSSSESRKVEIEWFY